MRLLKSVNPAIAAIAVVALVAAGLLLTLPGGDVKHLTADFPRTVSLYQGSDVKILGIAVGKVDSVTPMGTKVRVKMSYDAKYKIPADAKAAVISPSIVGDRFVQMTPVYRGGAVLPDNARLGVDRTATPLELDEIFGSLDQLMVALGPQGANKNGALSRLLDSTARNFGGQGAQVNQTITDLGKLTATLADNKDELFGTAAEIEKFVRTLAKNDDTVRRFNDSLAGGSQMLAEDRQELAAALKNLSVALVQVRGFVKENRASLTRNVAGLTQISNTVVKRRAELEESLHVAPLALNNLALAYNPVTGTLDTRDNIGEIGTQLKNNPGTVLCAFLSKAKSAGVPCPSNQLDDILGGALRGLPAPRSAPFEQALRARQAQRPQIDITLAGLVRGTR